MVAHSPTTLSFFLDTAFCTHPLGDLYEWAALSSVLSFYSLRGSALCSDLLSFKATQLYGAI